MHPLFKNAMQENMPDVSEKILFKRNKNWFERWFTSDHATMPSVIERFETDLVPSAMVPVGSCEQA